MQKWWTLLLMGMLAPAGCGSGDYGADTAEAEGGDGSRPAPGATLPERIEMHDNYFKPASISARPGSRVTLRLVNTGKHDHTFTIDSQNLDRDVRPGAPTQVTFTIPASGADTFYCRYHIGMTGRLGSPD